MLASVMRSGTDSAATADQSSARVGRRSRIASTRTDAPATSPNASAVPADIAGNDPVAFKAIAEKVFLITDARKHMKDLGQEFKAGPTYTKHQIMGKEFDPAKPEAYLASFPIKRTAA